MTQIELKNIRIFANHGCMQEEAKIGSDYTVDLIVEADLEKSSYSDELSHTVDYVLLNRIVTEEMLIRSNLLEHVAQRILTRIKTEVPEVYSAKLKVYKLNPPINGNVESVGIIMTF